MVRFSEINQFPHFLELLEGNFRTICPGLENIRILGGKVSAHVYTNTEKFHPSLPLRSASTNADRAQCT